MRCWLQTARVSVIQTGGSEWRGGEEFSFVSSSLRAFLELHADAGLFLLIKTSGEGFLELLDPKMTKEDQHDLIKGEENGIYLQEMTII